MARKRSYSSRFWSENIRDIYDRQNWPSVVEPNLENYVSPLLPQISRGYAIKPEDVSLILKSSSSPVVHSLKGKIATPVGEEPRLTGSFPPAPTHPGEPPEQHVEPRWSDFEPRVRYSGWLQGLKDVFSGAAGRREREARKRFEVAQQSFQSEYPRQMAAEESFRRSLALYESQIADFKQKKSSLEKRFQDAQARTTAHRQYCRSAQVADIAALDKLLAGARSGSTEGIQALCLQIYDAILLPATFPREAEANFDPADGILVCTIEVPNMDEIRMEVALKTKTRPANQKEIMAAQEFVVHALCLRLIHEIFATPEMEAVQLVGVNARLRFTNRSNGVRMNEIIGSLAATRKEFSTIQIAHVDAKQCFRSLKGISSPSFQEISPVRPILRFDQSDKRIVEGRDIVDNLDESTNLAAMDWEDFEHVVRELFAKLFTARGSSAEVHVTRASRDYGVDALVHDPDPIHGGKFVVQAKRYVNRVEVSAVRDLYGTIQNEGANRGYLVTTSSFGPDAHAFAKGKPITLIDGSHLLQLLQDHGYGFRIDLQEARNLLHGRE